MRIYPGVERRRRNGSVALLVLGSLPFLYWLVPKIMRVASGGPFFITVGVFDAFAVGLFGLAAWNVYRVRTRPEEHADLDVTAREARICQKGRVVRRMPFEQVGPVRMGALRQVIVESGTSESDRRTRSGRASFLVAFAGLPDYQLIDSYSQTRARRRMEAVARTTGLGAVTLGGVERTAEEVNLSLIERVQRRGERLTQPVAPAATPITVRANGHAIEIASSHRAMLPLAIAAGLPLLWLMMAIPLWPWLQTELQVEGSAPWVARGTLLVAAVPLLIAIAWQLRAGLFHGRIVIAPAGLRYRFARAPLAAVEEIAAGQGSAPRVWTDHGPIVISDGFCPREQYGYLAQVLRWAVVETAGTSHPHTPS